MVEPNLDHLRTLVASFPHLPGVYLMKSDAGTVLYVGKAIDLRARVGSYLNGSDTRFQISFLLELVHVIDKIVCENERQAFLLERDLIAKFKPKFNIRLKDDKAFLSVRLDRGARWPKLELVRRHSNDGADYYGPYAFSYELRRVLEVIKKVVPLRTCTDTVLYNRQRPCLEYQIKRCAGPCCLPVSEEDYQGWVRQAGMILDGKVKPILEDLGRRMQEASEELRFEAAAAIRDRIDVLQQFAEGQRVMFARGENTDAFAIHREGDIAALTVLRVRHGRIADTKNFALTDVVVSDEEILRASIGQFYEAVPEVPQEIIVSQEVAELDEVLEALSQTLDEKIAWSVPQRGAKMRLLKLAELNARQYFISKFSRDSRYSAVAKQLALLLHLTQMPRRIETVDISNLQGSDIVGAIAVFFDGEPLKKEYRRYKISQQGKPDDFASIYEVVHRRLTRGMETGELPDLLIVDGGLGQLSMACKARDELGIQLDIVALAKMRSEEGRKTKGFAIKEERIHVEWQQEAVPLEPSAAITLMLQRMRDEVHNLVIKFHRDKRGQRALESVLDTVPGVGLERRKRLLKAFGGLQHIAAAAPEEVAKAGRMSILIAEKVIAIAKK